MVSMDKQVILPPPVPVRDSSKEPILDYSQRRNYPVLIPNDDLCGRGYDKPADLSLDNFDYERDIFLVMVVKSSCAMGERRDAVRATWANESWAKRELGVNVKHLFLLGRCTSDLLTEHVKVESQLHHDIIQWDFHDSFRNLTVKEVLFLQWYVRSCRNVPFVFKGDDDVFVNTRSVVEYLRHEVKPNSRRDLFVGSRLQGSPRILDPTWKYYVSYNLFPDKYYPPYVSGGGFIMSSSVAVRLFEASLHVRIFPIDDAFVGTLLQHVGVDPKNDPRFKSWGMDHPSGCRLAKVFTYHKATPLILLKQWKDVTELKEGSCANN